MAEMERSARLDPLPPEHSPELKEEFDSFFKTLGFVPNSVLTMQRKPKLAKAFVQMQRALWDPAICQPESLLARAFRFAADDKRQRLTQIGLPT